MAGFFHHIELDSGTPVDEATSPELIGNLRRRQYRE
jgi:hypothetical protein